MVGTMLFPTSYRQQHLYCSWRLVYWHRHLQRFRIYLKQITMNKPQLTQKFLDKLQEESAEIIQAVSKIRRFGPDNKHPDRQETNKQELMAELEDFLALLGALEHLEYINLETSPPNIAKKLAKLFEQDQQ